MKGGSGGLEVRTHGEKGPVVLLLHGGPGAPGNMAPVARGLENAFRALEPFQRRSGGAPLTVARHVADLHAIVEPLGRPALVGSSWGAMLALAYAAAHPKSAGPLVLVGCGTFDLASRARFQATVDERMDADLRRRIEALEREIPDADRRLAAVGDLLAPVYSFDPLPGGAGFEACDARGHEEAWADMLRLQADGTYPAAFAAITSPVLMLHGAHDPHPGASIRASLAPHVKDLTYVEWERCGHYPWLEREARAPFFRTLRDWLGARLAR
ncbi:MAG TPA: alpha/beta hydrolase [Planctomycetota bacterium]|nr:alpha/beta hydrolase [Planctomycetota bacterium]